MAIDHDGWLSTGDVGYLDEDGYLFLVDRKKDLIVRGGYNVYPREVEEALYAHPDVLEAAVVGIADELLGEEVAAFVVRRPGATASADELQAWTKERVAAYKYPRRIVFVDDLPKGPTGKILEARDRSRRAAFQVLGATRSTKRRSATARPRDSSPTTWTKGVRSIVQSRGISLKPGGFRLSQALLCSPRRWSRSRPRISTSREQARS